MELARKLIRYFAFLDHIKAAAVNHPELRRTAGRAHSFLFFAQTRIQPGKVIGRADPHDAGKHVYPPRDQAEPFVESWIDVHLGEWHFFWSAATSRRFLKR